MRNPIHLVSIALLGFLTAVSGPDPAAWAAPSKRTIQPPSKPPQSRVFTKEGAPAIKLADAVEMQPLVPKPPPGPGDAGWTAPVVEPFAGKLKFSPKTTFVDPAGLRMIHAHLQVIDQYGTPSGIYFDGIGSLGISMPATAIGGSDLLMSCFGELPPKISAYARWTGSGGSGWRRLMDLSNPGDKAKFVVVPGDLDANTIFEIGLFVESDDHDWRVDRCTIRRLPA